jgi:hypothetical protein
MEFNWDIYSDGEIDRMSGRLQPGESMFRVISAETKTSKNNNQMLEVTLEIHDKNGASLKVKDWFVNLPNMAWKIKAFCEAADIIYQHGKCDTTSIVNKAGNCITAYEKSKEDASKEYLAIKRYVKINKMNPPADDNLRREDKVRAETIGSPSIDGDMDVPF